MKPSKLAKRIGRTMLLAGVFCLLGCLFSVPVFGASSAGTDSGFASGMAYLGAAISTGVAAIGGGIAVGGGAPAAIGALTEDPKSFGKSLIFVALGEGIALYGMLIAILILNNA